MDTVDELTSDLDAGVAALERVHAKLKGYRASVLKAAVEGALTTEWRANHPAKEPAPTLLQRILVERRRHWEDAQLQEFKAAGRVPPKSWKAKYREPTVPGAKALPALPADWCWASLDQLLFEIEAGKSFVCEPRPARANEWGVIKVSAMSWGDFDEAENKAVPAGRTIDPRHEISRGDILLSRANTFELVGASVLVRDCRPRLLLSDKSMRLHVSPLVDRTWLSTILSTAWVRRQLSSKSTGMKEGMRNVSQEGVLSVLIPLAPADECRALAETVEEHVSAIGRLERDLEAKIRAGDALRQSILRHAFSGQLVAQDPNDEPATALLKRIAAERERRTQSTTAKRSPRRSSATIAVREEHIRD